MKKACLFLLLAISFAACKGKKDIPDISGIKVNLGVERFDENFFAQTSLAQLKAVIDEQVQ